MLILSADLFSSFTGDQRGVKKGLLLKLNTDPSGQSMYSPRAVKRRKQGVAGLQEVGGRKS